ncbi:hypothetical protein Tco_1146718 [Tanacetum coccineum]
MEHGFLSQKKSGGGRGVKEKSLNRNLMNTSSGIGVSTESIDTMNEDTPVDVASAVKEGVTPSVVDMTVEMEKISSLEDTTVLGSFPPLSTPITSTAGNSFGKSSYVNVTSKPSGKKLNIHTLFTPGGNRIDVVVPIESIRVISERFVNTTYGFFLRKRVAYPIVTNYVKNTWSKYGLVRSMFSSSTDLFSFQFSSMEGLDAMLENGPCAILRSIMMWSKAPMGGHHLRVNNGVTSSGSSFMNVDNSSTGTTSIIDKIGKFEELLTSGQAILVDEAGNPLKKVEFSGDYDSEDDVASVDNYMTRSMASERVDPYDDDMYECHNLPQELQAICDNLDIRVRGRNKK